MDNDDLRRRAADDFQQGRFDEADAACIKLLSADDSDAPTLRRRGEIALLANRLDDAEQWLERTLKLLPGDAQTARLLAEAHYRRDNYASAAELLRMTGNVAAARKLEALPHDDVHVIEGPDATEVEFLATDPLPLISLYVNDEPVNFIIDTGGPEPIVDADLAAKLALPSFGEDSGTFAAGKQAAVGHSCLETLVLGDIAVRNLPVLTMAGIGALGGLYGGTHEVHGILGTVTLYHFLSTLDYPGRRLVLERRTQDSGARREQQAQARGDVAAPFWMAGDHYVVAWVAVNGLYTTLCFVDTGLAGGGFTCPKATVDAAKITLLAEQAREVSGPGQGAFTVTPMLVDELALGGAREPNVTGSFGFFPASLEEGQGFHIGGLISHLFFKPYELTFDFEGMRLYLHRAAH